MLAQFGKPCSQVSTTFFVTSYLHSSRAYDATRVARHVFDHNPEAAVVAAAEVFSQHVGALAEEVERLPVERLVVGVGEGGASLRARVFSTLPF